MATTMQAVEACLELASFSLCKLEGKKHQAINRLTLNITSVGVLAALYFIGGAFYNYKVYNARGLDLIPHRGKILLLYALSVYNNANDDNRDRFLARFALSHQGPDSACH